VSASLPESRDNFATHVAFICRAIHHNARPMTDQKSRRKLSMSAWKKGLLAVAMAASLTACGGGGDETNSLRAGDQFGSDNDPEFFNPTTPTPTDPTPSGSAAGIWFGSTRPDINPNAEQSMLALVTEEGDFVAVGGYTNVDVYLFVGQNTGANGVFDADPATYNGLEYVGESSLMGTAVASTSFQGSFSVGTSTAEFALDYSSLYNRSASLEKLQGVYTYDGPDGLHSIVVDASGNLTGEDYDGCTLSGSVTVPHADRNYYRFTGTLGDCSIYDGPMHGLIYLDDDLGATDNVIVLLGESNSRSTAVIVTGVK
jgi:hypothetical protein